MIIASISKMLYNIWHVFIMLLLYSFIANITEPTFAWKRISRKNNRKHAANAKMSSVKTTELELKLA